MALSFSLDGVGFVTGAGGGIGARVAIGLAECGVDVACLETAEESLSPVVESIEEVGRRAIPIVGDVSSLTAMRDAVATAQDALGPLRYAVNCAGISHWSKAEDMSVEQWQRVIDVNLTGIFNSSQAQGRAMLKHGRGSIVNIGSISASIANRGLEQVHYNASKAGVVHFSKSLALEWARRNVRVNTVSPGYTWTPMAADPAVAEHIEGISQDIPMGRMADPVEMAAPAMFLLSDAASYLTGHDLLVDGGVTCW